MTLPIPFFRSQPPPEMPAIVRAVSQQDMQWDRPVFKAPPLRVTPPLPDVRDLPADVSDWNRPVW